MREEVEDLEWNDIKSIHQGDLLAISVNIGDSFKNKLDSIFTLIEQTNSDLLFILEVHSFEEEIINLNQMFIRLGYDLIVNCETKPPNDLANFSKKSKRTPKGGIVALIKKNLIVDSIEKVINKSAIKILFSLNNDKIEIFGVYAPSNCYPIIERNNWWGKLYDNFKKSEYKKILIGDLNVHLIEELDHKLENSCPIIENVEKVLTFVIDSWRENNPDIRLASFSKSLSSTRIDYALIDAELEQLTETFYLPWNFSLSSDHRAVGIWLKNEHDSQITVPINLSSVTKINVLNFKNLELQEKFKEATNKILFPPSNDIDKISYSLVNELSKLIESNFGTIVFKNTQLKNKEPRFLMNLNIKINKLKKAVASFPLAYKYNIITKAIDAAALDIDINLACPNLSVSDWFRWKREAVITLNILLKNWRKMNRKYQKEKIEKAVNRIMEMEIKNPKIFNRKFNWKKQDFSPLFPQRLLINNELITDQQIIENSMRNFWEKTFTSNKEEKINHSNAPWFKSNLVKKWKESLSNNTTLLDDISLDELKSVTNNMTRGKSPGPDGLYSESWIFSSDKILIQLANIFNLCLKTSIIPEEWKVAKIRLIYKGGKESPENFRPIALLSSIYKIFTSIINKRINFLIHNFNLIPEHQSGFYKGRSTASRIWVLISIINHQKLINDNLHVLYLDIKKAYDSVEPDYLVETLNILGFPTTFIKLMENIYNNSIASILTNSGTTDPFIISKGVKQGCPLSPTLFIIFIEPLLSWLNDSQLGVHIKDICHTVGGFADDLIVTTSSLFNLKLALNMICNFLNLYNLELNIDHSAKNKTVYSSFGNKETLIYEDIKHRNVEIPFISSNECYKYLGVYINLDLNWDRQKIILWSSFQKQINFLCNKCLNIKQVTKILNIIIIPALYYSLQFFNLSKIWAAKFERKLALLLSKFLHIPESSPLHFQRSYSEGSFNLTKFKMSHVNLPILSLLRVINSIKDKKTSKTILNSLDSILGELRFPKGITNIMINPALSDIRNLTNLKWFLYDYDLINKLSKVNITSIQHILKRGILIPFDVLKSQIKRTYSKNLITLENYKYLEDTLCNNDKTLKSSVLDILNSQYNKINIFPPYTIINNRICIFTDASEDDVATGYAIYMGENNNFNKAENIPFMSNNRAEIFAILQTLRRLPFGHQIYIFSDSKLATQSIANNSYLEFNKSESLDFLREITSLLTLYEQNGGSVVIEHINSHLDNQNTVNYFDKFNKLKQRFPNDWEKIIEGNKNVDILAKEAKSKIPEHKFPPSIHASKIILITEQGEIISSNFKRALKDRVDLEDKKLYKSKKRIKCLLQNLKVIIPQKILIKDLWLK